VTVTLNQLLAFGVLHLVLTLVSRHLLLRRLLILFNGARIDKIDIERRLQGDESAIDMHTGQLRDLSGRVLNLETWRHGVENPTPHGPASTLVPR
jgi:hypothetical protein